MRTWLRHRHSLHCNTMHTPLLRCRDLGRAGAAAFPDSCASRRQSSVSERVKGLSVASGAVMVSRFFLRAHTIFFLLFNFPEYVHAHGVMRSVGPARPHPFRTRHPLHPRRDAATPQDERHKRQQKKALPIPMRSSNNTLGGRCRRRWLARPRRCGPAGPSHPRGRAAPSETAAAGAAGVAGVR